MLCFYKLVREYFNSFQYTMCFVFVKILFCFVIVMSSLVFHLLPPLFSVVRNLLFQSLLLLGKNLVLSNCSSARNLPLDGK